MQAEPFYVWASRNAQQQPERLETALVLHDFAGLRYTQGHVSESAQLYQQALAIRETILGPEHPQTLDTHTRLSEVLDQKLERAPTEVVNDLWHEQILPSEC